MEAARDPVYGSLGDLQADQVKGKPPPYASRKAYQQIFGSRSHLLERRRLSGSVGDLPSTTDNRDDSSNSKNQVLNTGSLREKQYKRYSSWFESPTSENTYNSQPSVYTPTTNEQTKDKEDHEASTGQGKHGPVKRQNSWERNFSAGLERLHASKQGKLSAKSITTPLNSSPDQSDSCDSEGDSSKSPKPRRSTPRQYSSLELLINDGEEWQKEKLEKQHKANISLTSSLECLSNGDNEQSSNKNTETNSRSKHLEQNTNVHEAHPKIKKPVDKQNKHETNQATSEYLPHGEANDDHDQSNQALARHNRDNQQPNQITETQKVDYKETNGQHEEQDLRNQKTNADVLELSEQIITVQDNKRSEAHDQDRSEVTEILLIDFNETSEPLQTTNQAAEVKGESMRDEPAPMRDYDVRKRDDVMGRSFSPSSTSSSSSGSTFSPYIPESQHHPSSQLLHESCSPGDQLDTSGLHVALPVFITDTPPLSPGQETPNDVEEGGGRVEESSGGVEEGGGGVEGNTISTLKREVLHLTQLKEQFQDHLFNTQTTMKDGMSQLEQRLAQQQQQQQQERDTRQQVITQLQQEIQRLQQEIQRLQQELAKQQRGDRKDDIVASQQVQTQQLQREIQRLQQELVKQQRGDSNEDIINQQQTEIEKLKQALMIEQSGHNSTYIVDQLQAEIQRLQQGNSRREQQLELQQVELELKMEKDSKRQELKIQKLQQDLKQQKDIGEQTSLQQQAKIKQLQEELKKQQEKNSRAKQEEMQWLEQEIKKQQELEVKDQTEINKLQQELNKQRGNNEQTIYKQQADIQRLQLEIKQQQDSNKQLILLQQAEIQRLQLEIKQQQGSNVEAILEQQIEMQRKEIQLLKQQLKSLENSNKELANHQEQVQHLKRELKQQERTNQEQQTYIQQLQKEMKAQRDAHEQTIMKQQTEIERLQQALQKQQERDSLEQLLNQQQKDLQHILEKQQKSSEQVTLQKAEIQQLQQELAQQRERNSRDQQRIQQLEQELKQGRESSEQKHRQQQNQQQEIQQLQQERHNREQQERHIREQQLEIQRLKEELQNLQESTQSSPTEPKLKRRLSELREQLQEEQQNHQAQLSVKKREVSTLKSQLAERERDLENLQVQASRSIRMAKLVPIDPPAEVQKVAEATVEREGDKFTPERLSKAKAIIEDELTSEAVTKTNIKGLANNRQDLVPMEEDTYPDRQREKYISSERSDDAVKTDNKITNTRRAPLSQDLELTKDTNADARRSVQLASEGGSTTPRIVHALKKEKVNTKPSEGRETKILTRTSSGSRPTNTNSDMSSWASESSLRDTTDSKTRFSKLRKSYENLASTSTKEFISNNMKDTTKTKKSANRTVSHEPQTSRTQFYSHYQNRSPTVLEQSRMRDATETTPPQNSHTRPNSHYQAQNPTNHEQKRTRDARQTTPPQNAHTQANLHYQALSPTDYEPRRKRDKADIVTPPSSSRHSAPPHMPESVINSSPPKGSAGYNTQRGQPIQQKTAVSTRPVSNAQTSSLGLPNLGNTSYINSVLQCLFNVEPLRLYFGQIYSPQREGGELVGAVAGVFLAIETGMGVHQAMTDLKMAVECRDKVFRLHPNPPAHHLLSSLMSWLHDDLATPPSPQAGSLGLSTSVVSGLFHGLRESVVVCPVKSRVVSAAPESFHLLTLTPRDRSSVTLQALMEERFEPHDVPWDCGECRTKHTCTHITKLHHLPDNLTIIIARSRGTEEGSPSSSQVILPPSSRLSLTRHMVEGTKRRADYTLSGVVHHSGTITSGHYTAYCRSGAGRWWLWDDTDLIGASWSDVQALTDHHILFFQIIPDQED